MKNKSVFRVFSVLLSLLMGVSLFLSTPARPVSAAYWTVTKVADTNDGVCNADCSLREAIAAAAGSGDTIVFVDEGFDWWIHLGSELVINKSVTIDGSNVEGVQLSSAYNHRTFFVNPGKWLTLKNLTLDTGKSEGTAGGGLIFNNGGTVTIYDGNLVSGQSYKGAIYNETGGMMNIYRTGFSNHQADITGSKGGAIYNNGNINVYDSKFLGNSAELYGGAIYNAGVLTVSESIFMGNYSLNASGGGIYNAYLATATINNCTFTENLSASGGAAIKGADLSTLYVNNSTFTNGNAGENVGGLYTSGNLTMSNTILANSTDGGKDCHASGPTKYFYNNLIESNSTGDAACGTPVTTADPLLEALEWRPPSNDMGWLPLPENSPAVDAGDDATCLLYDTRGVLRPFGLHCDIGSYEFVPDPVVASLSPAFVMAGSPEFFLFVNGSGFHTSSVVQWNGINLDTVLINSTQLKGTVSAAMIAGIAQVYVNVETPGLLNPLYDPALFYVHTFADVLPTHPLWRYVEGFFDKGITTGCNINPLRYCPDQVVTRGQMAVFLLRAVHEDPTTVYIPEDVEPDIFSDSPKAAFMEPWIEQFYVEGYTTGCATNPLRYCPEKNITRGEMAVFLLRAKHGSSYIPEDVEPDVFIDPPKNAWMEPWIEQFYTQKYTTGCSGTIPGVDLRYCPERNAGRAEMATFIDRIFDFPPLPAVITLTP